MPLTDQERFVACLTGRPVDRPPYWLFWGPWTTAWERWQREGMPFQDWTDVRAHFDADQAVQTVPVNCGPCPPFERQTLAEDEESFVWIDTWGIKRRNLKNCESMSEFLEFPVKNREDWERYRSERLRIDHPARLAGDWLARCRTWMAAGIPIQLGYFPDVTLFGGVRWLLGDEECLLAFYTMPDLVAEIMNHLTNLYLHVFERVLAAGVRVDVIHIWEDMSGRQGPLISPAHFRQFMTPQYAQIKALADRYDVPLMSVDTDGNPNLIVPPMMEGGVNYLFPLEVAAGVDANAFRARYPTLAFMGGFDKRAAARGPQAIDAELERLRPAVQQGRYIPEFDHLIPDDVSWESYRHYACRLRDLVGKR
ncbi:hypothetical protein HQ590_06285 [bacterium]|nr:hypothetical protein [bacterium]